MIVPDSQFRPNPARAVFVSGQINQALIDRLTPEILRLQSASRDPISVYIDSPGGSTVHAERLIQILGSSNQDLDTACRLITVVTSVAASAAADVLSSGDYAIAYPDSTIIFHGVRTQHDELTVERAARLAEYLKISNDRYAMSMAKKSEWRFMFLFVSLRGRFNSYRLEMGKKTLTDLECFTAMIAREISPDARHVLDSAQGRAQRYDALMRHVLKRIRPSRRFTDDGGWLYVESAMIKAIVDFERLAHRKDKGWSFSKDGLSRLSDDFFLLNEYLSSAHGEQFKGLCQRWGDYILSPEERQAIADTPNEERSERKLELTNRHFGPLWAFFIALCHALQEGENVLTAADAYWLGLIDEVLGNAKLPSMRLFAEFRDDFQTGTEAETG